MPLQSWGQLLNDAGDTSFDVLPAADYDLKMVKVEAKQSKNGKLMFAYTADVTAGPYKGRKVFGNLVVSPDNPTALNIFFRQVQAIGISRDFFTNNPSDSQVAEALNGREFRGQVGVRSWQGQDRNEVKSYSPITKTAAAGSPVPPAPMTAPAAPAGMPSATAAPTVAPAPQAAPPAAAAAAPQVAPTSAPAPAPVVQPATPPVEGEPVVNTEAPAPQAAPAEAPARPF